MATLLTGWGRRGVGGRGGRREKRKKDSRVFIIIAKGRKLILKFTDQFGQAAYRAVA